MKSLINKYKEYNSKVLAAPLKFLTNPKIPTFLKVITLALVCGLIYFIGSRPKQIKNVNGYSVEEITGTYKSEYLNLGVKQQAELILNKDKTFEAILYMDGKPTRTLKGIWRNFVFKDSVFDYGKLKEIKVTNNLECIDNQYHMSSKYTIDLPQISAFSVLQGTTTDMLFGGMVNDYPLKKK